MALDPRRAVEVQLVADEMVMVGAAPMPATVEGLAAKAAMATTEILGTLAEAASLNHAAICLRPNRQCERQVNVQPAAMAVAMAVVMVVHPVHLRAPVGNRIPCAPALT